MSCGVGHRHSSDLAWLWPWRRPAATAPIRPLAWETPYATGVALKEITNKQKTGINEICKILKIIAQKSNFFMVFKKTLKIFCQVKNKTSRQKKMKDRERKI